MFSERPIIADSICLLINVYHWENWFFWGLGEVRFQRYCPLVRQSKKQEILVSECRSWRLQFPLWTTQRFTDNEYFCRQFLQILGVDPNRCSGWLYFFLKFLPNILLQGQDDFSKGLQTIAPTLLLTSIPETSFPIFELQSEHSTAVKVVQVSLERNKNKK